MSRKLFTKEEDAVILRITTEATNNGIPLSTAFIKAADELEDRDVDSVQRRYNRIAKGKSVLSENELIVIKLKAIARDRTRDAEKVGKFKETHDELKKKNAQLQKDFDDLQRKYNELKESVMMALGEEVASTSE